MLFDVYNGQRLFSFYFPLCGLLLESEFMTGWMDRLNDNTRRLPTHRGPTTTGAPTHSPLTLALGVLDDAGATRGSRPLESRHFSEGDRPPWNLSPRVGRGWRGPS